MYFFTYFTKICDTNRNFVDKTKIHTTNMNETISDFTDVFDDEIGDSQPLSLTSSIDSNVKSCVKVKENVTERPAKHTGQNGSYRSVEEIDPKYRSVFSYPFFNLVQSKVIEDALYSDKSLVVCAPTGSGKTVVFEMAIVQLLMEMDDQNCNEDFKIIYMAPVKAVCTERLTEWYPKFTKLRLLCIEVTGDTDVDFSQLKPYKIIITTPEKWDVLTRRWTDYSGLVGMIKLFLIDEVHILNDESRGPVLEAVVSRMKTIESSSQSAYRIEKLQRQNQGIEEPMGSPPKIRFVAVSATVSNPEDVAVWLTSREKPAVFHKFGEDARPVKLKRVVEGYHCGEGSNIFKFDIMLNYKLWPIIQKYYDGKPTLIFCNTRKGVLQTAERLSLELTIKFNSEQKAKLTALASTIKNKKLQTLIASGVGCHHAGLLYEERVNIERAFRERDLPILITTTTLAMGVNLPAHLVIVKNTQQYVNGAYQEYSISTVLQMVGRAGRPQFDTEATAVIMTRMQDKQRYESLVGGSEPLQSYLHKRLTENLNSEAALHTVTDVAQCVQWLQSTFLYVRAAKDPRRYLGLPSDAAPHLISKKIEELCVIAMNGLASSGLITMDEACCIESTQAGRLMSVYYLDFETMKMIMKIEGTETLEQLLWLVCSCHELSDMHLRMDERRFLNTLNRNNTAHTIRFPMKGRITTRQMKLSCMIQAILGSLPIPDPSLYQEAMRIMRIADRVGRCVAAYVLSQNLTTSQSQFHAAVLNSILLSKCLSAQLWENSPFVSRQLKGIGPTFSTLLVTAGKTNFMLLEETHPRDLERIMNKGPPAGNVVRKQISLIPKYQVTLTSVDEKTARVQLLLLNQSHLSENMDNLTAGDGHKSYILVGDSENYVLLLKSFRDKELITLNDGTLTYMVTRKHRFEHKIMVHCISTSYVGIDAQCEFTFKGLDPIEPRVTYQQNTLIDDTSGIKITKKQTNITDTFKERKRRINDNDVTQSKEKIKRDSVLLERFKKLKQSFGNTTKELQNDLQNTAKMSNFQEIINQDKPTSQNMCIENEELDDEFQTVIPAYNQHPSTAMPKESTDELPLDIDESSIIDDSHIDSILNKIESEICKNKTDNLPEVVLNRHNVDTRDESSCIDTGLCSYFQDVSSNDTKSGSVASTRYSGYSKINAFRNRTHPTKTTKLYNYSFMELLEKNIDISDDEVICEKRKPIGFSEAIKDHIQQFLQRAKTSAIKTKMNVLDKDLLENPLVSINITDNAKDEEYGNSMLSADCTIVKDNEVFRNNNEYHANQTIDLINEDVDNHTEEYAYTNTATKTDDSKNNPVDKTVSAVKDNGYNFGKGISTVQQLFQNLSTENKHRDETIESIDLTAENECNALLQSLPGAEGSVNEEQTDTYHNMSEIKPTEYKSKSLVPFEFKYPLQNQNLTKIKNENYKEHNAKPPHDMVLSSMVHVTSVTYPVALGVNIRNSVMPFEVEPKLNDQNDLNDITLNNKQIEQIERREINDLTPYRVQFKTHSQQSMIPFTGKHINYSHEGSLVPTDSNKKSAVIQFNKNLEGLMANKGSMAVSTNGTLATKSKPYSPQIFNIPSKAADTHVNRREIIETRPRYRTIHNEENSSNKTYTRYSEDSVNGPRLQYMKKYSYTATEMDVWTKSDNSRKLIKKLKMDLDITEIVSQETIQDNCKSDEFSDTQLNNLVTDKHTDNYGTKDFVNPLSNNYMESCNKAEMVSESTIMNNTASQNKINQDNDQIKDFFAIDRSNDQGKEFITDPKERTRNYMTKDSVDSILANNYLNTCEKAETASEQKATNDTGSQNKLKQEKDQTKELITSAKSNVQSFIFITGAKDSSNVNSKPDISRKIGQHEQSNDNKVEKPKSTVDNIVQKYANALRDKAKFTQAMKRDKQSYETVPRNPKPKRPFKITDINRIDATLPKIFTDITPTPDRPIPVAKNNIEDGKMQHQDTNLKDAIPTMHVARNNLNPPFVEEIEKDDDITELMPSPNVNCADLESINNYKIDHSMLDPKTLLQFLSPQDEDKIIPPPMEFRDDSNQLYSPTRSNSDTNDEMFKHASFLEDANTFDDRKFMTSNPDREGKSIFEDNDRLEMTPSKEIETWTLSKEEPEPLTSPTNSPFQSFTIVREPATTLRPRIMGSINNRFMMDRKSKLAKFKLNMKPKCKARRNMQ